MKATERYILKHRKPVPCPDLLKWSLWLERNRNKVRIRRTVENDILISTVFLGLDHCFKGKGILFETMCFRIEDGKVNYMDIYCNRCRTHREALKMHWEAVEAVRN
jgi:hypothetical protein